MLLSWTVEYHKVSQHSPNIAALNVQMREKADVDYLLCFDLPTNAMEGEIASAGRYRHPLFDREYDRLQVVTVAELFAPRNRRLDLPMARDAVKAASAVRDDGGQGALL